MNQEKCPLVTMDNICNGDNTSMLLKERETLMEPEWSKMPRTFGFYWKANNLKDWDIGEMVSVSRVERANEVFFEVDCYRVFQNQCWWYGPFRIESPPPSLTEK